MVRGNSVHGLAKASDNNYFKSLIIFLLVFTFHNVFAQKTNPPKKATTTQKAKSPAVAIESASTEVLFFIKKTDFYDLTKEIDISYLENKPAGTGVLFEYHGPQSIDCHQKLDAQASTMLREVRSKKDNLDYTLVVDWVACKIISLTPSSDKYINDKYSYTLYHISLTPESPNKKESVKESKPTAKTEKPSAVKRPLLVTQVDTWGEWLATGPYGTSMPYNSEKEAIKELFYDEPGAITFLCQRKNFKIYAINIKTDNVRVDVRNFLKEFDITDVPN